MTGNEPLDLALTIKDLTIALIAKLLETPFECTQDDCGQNPAIRLARVAWLGKRWIAFDNFLVSLLQVHN
jgi:hypothetical protein